MSVTSRAVVTTETPDRYAKQLAAHLGRRLEVDEEERGTRIRFPAGDCLMACESGRLVLDASAPGPDDLDRVEDVVGRHLERFGQRAGLAVEWRR